MVLLVVVVDLVVVVVVGAAVACRKNGNASKEATLMNGLVGNLQHCTSDPSRKRPNNETNVWTYGLALSGNLSQTG